MIGQAISHYTILEKLGAGGMGVVYKAYDTKLNRTVALKFLPADFIRDAEAIDRFINEAQAASSLDHPNICTIYEIDETNDGHMFICMAYYPGETLRMQMAKGKLHTREILGTATQIGQGLHAAHEAGIIHRDIKPGNVIITERDEVKIIDFGVAKLAGQSQITKTGNTPGTLAYMAPEQVQKQVVDHRTDIWSLGVVLYEMLTGNLPFQGENDAALIFSIVKEEPEPLARHRVGATDGLQRIIDKALSKEIEMRYESIDEMLVDLEKELRGESALITPRQRIKRKTFGAVGILGNRLIRFVLPMLALTVAAIIAFVAIFDKPQLPKLPATHRQITYTGKALWPAVSPDGSLVAYTTESQGHQQVIVEELASGKTSEIFSGDYISYLLWSRDGTRLFLLSQLDDSTSAVFSISRSDGGVEKLSLKRLTSFISLSPDGSTIASGTLSLRRIWLTSISTGDTTSIPIRASFSFFRNIHWSPKGDRLLFQTSTQNRPTLRTIKIDGSGQQHVWEDSVIIQSPRWSANGDAIYFHRAAGGSSDLMKIGIDPATGEVRGSPQALQTGLEIGTYFTLSRDGRRLVYSRNRSESSLWRVDPEEAVREPLIRAKRLTGGTAVIRRPRLSPDGKRIAFKRTVRPYSNLFVISVDGGDMRQLTHLKTGINGIAWSPGGNEIIYGSSAKSAKPKIWRISANGGTPRALSHGVASTMFNFAWAPGRYILYQTLGNHDFSILDPKTGNERLLLASEQMGRIFAPRSSPDGKHVAAYWNRRKIQPGLWIFSLEDSSKTRLLERGVYPIVWSEDSEWIYAWRPDEKPFKIFKVSVKTGQIEPIVTLPDNNIDRFDDVTITPDGKIIVYAGLETWSDVWMMENFDPEVR